MLKLATEKIKVAEITVEDLVREALSMPIGWKEEIFVEDGEVSFSGPMTKSTYSGKTPFEPLDSYVGDLESMSISDFEEFYERDDGKVEICDNDNQQSDEYNTYAKGEYYDWAEIVDHDEAVYRISLTCDFPDSEMNQLLELIQEATKKISA